MFCTYCGSQVNEYATFCAKCGKPIRGIGSSQQAIAPQGRWENKEFSEPILGRPRFRTAGSFEHDYLQNLAQAMRSPIDAAVQSLLKQLTPLGWEPIEPTDAGRLVLASRVVMRKVETGNFSIALLTLGTVAEPKVWNELLEVRVTFRRWVTQDQLQREQAVESKQDYDGATFDMLMEMNGTRDFNKRREIIKHNIGRVMEPSFLPSFYLQLDIFREQGEQSAEVADNMNAALVLEIQDLVKKGNISSLVPGAVVANLVIIDDPVLYHLDSDLEAYSDAYVQVIGKNFVQLYPRIRQIRDEIRDYFATISAEAEARIQYLRSQKLQTKLAEHADSWRAIAKQTEVMADMMDAIQADPPDNRAIALLSSYDADLLVAMSVPLAKAFELLGDREKKERTNRAVTKALLRL